MPIPNPEMYEYIFLEYKSKLKLNGQHSRFVKSRGIQFAAPVQRDKPPQVAHAHLWGSKQLSLAYTTQYAQYSGN